MERLLKNLQMNGKFGAVLSRDFSGVLFCCDLRSLAPDSSVPSLVQGTAESSYGRTTATAKKMLHTYAYLCVAISTFGKELN